MVGRKLYLGQGDGLTLGEWLVYWAAILLLVYGYLLVVCSPFVIARLLMGRWPWPLGEGFAERPNNGPMRPGDGMMWDDAPGTGRSPEGPGA